MVTGHDNMMISNRIGQEIAGLVRRQTEDDLGSAKVWLGLISKQRSFSNKRPSQIPGDLENGNRSLIEMAPYTYSDIGLEMSIECI